MSEGNPIRIDSIHQLTHERLKLVMTVHPDRVELHAKQFPQAMTHATLKEIALLFSQAASFIDEAEKRGQLKPVASEAPQVV